VSRETFATSGNAYTSSETDIGREKERDRHRYRQKDRNQTKRDRQIEKKDIDRHVDRQK